MEFDSKGNKGGICKYWKT